MNPEKSLSRRIFWTWFQTLNANGFPGGEGRATEGSLGSGEPLRSLNPSPRIRIRILLLCLWQETDFHDSV